MALTLNGWVQQQLDRHEGITYTAPLVITPLQGDAGLRQYYRVSSQPSLLAVTAPVNSELSESAAHFSALAALLREQGVPTPQVIACDAQQNWMLLEDLGPTAFLDVLSHDSVDLLYSEALMVLSRLQQIPRNSLSIDDYSLTVLMEEMRLFQQWFVEALLGYPMTPSDVSVVTGAFEFLVSQAEAQPQVLVHRDYHSRNLIYRDGEAPGVIDFQDALWGPITYDVVSLLRDCYIQWHPQQVERWVLAYGNLAIELGIMDAIDSTQWRGWFDAMGMQRHFKVLGVFARLHLRDNKSRYLQDLPLVWHYLTDIAQQYPQTVGFARWCESTLQPLVEQQPWFTAVCSHGEMV